MLVSIVYMFGPSTFPVHMPRCYSAGTSSGGGHLTTVFPRQRYMDVVLRLRRMTPVGLLC